MTLSNIDVRKTLGKSIEIESLDEFTQDERQIYTQLMFRAMFSFSDDHYRWTLGALEETEWEDTLALLRSGYISFKAFRMWWDQVGTRFYGPRFVNFMNSEIKDAGSS